MTSQSDMTSSLAVSGKIEVFAVYEFRYVKGHIEVFLNGKFQFSADNMREVREELREMKGETV